MPLRTVRNIYKYYNSHTKSILQVTVVILFVLIIFLWKKPPKTVSIVKEGMTSLTKLKQIEDKNAKLWGVLKQTMLSAKEAELKRDSLAKALGLKPKYIKGREIIVTKSDTIFKKLPTVTFYSTEYKDTVYRVRKVDPYIDVEAVVGKNIGDISVKSRDTITRLIVTKHPLFGAVTTSIYLSNKNPYNSIGEGSSFVIKEKKPILTFGPVVSYDVISKKPSVGIGVAFSLFSIKK